MDLATAVLSVLMPVRAFFGAGQPVLVDIQPPGEPVQLVVTDFIGRQVDANQDLVVDTPQQVDLLKSFSAIKAGTFVIAPVDVRGSAEASLIGTPLVVNVRADTRPAAPGVGMFAHVMPLEYVVLDTEEGPITIALRYDLAPNHVDHFLDLARNGFYDGLTFHRNVPRFILQGGDPLGDGTGNSGRFIDAEFSTVNFSRGTVGVARQVDPFERQGALPRLEFADTGSSQFFIALHDETARRLTGRYTALGRVVRGMEVVDRLAARPIADEATGRPRDPAVIKTARVLPVKPGEPNPYRELFEQELEAASRANRAENPFDDVPEDDPQPQREPRSDREGEVEPRADNVEAPVPAVPEAGISVPSDLGGPAEVGVKPGEGIE